LVAADVVMYSVYMPPSKRPVRPRTPRLPDGFFTVEPMPNVAAVHAAVSAPGATATNFRKPPPPAAVSEPA